MPRTVRRRSKAVRSVNPDWQQQRHLGRIVASNQLAIDIAKVMANHGRDAIVRQSVDDTPTIIWTASIRRW